LNIVIATSLTIPIQSIKYLQSYCINLHKLETELVKCQHDTVHNRIMALSNRFEAQEFSSSTAQLCKDKDNDLITCDHDRYVCLTI